MKTLSHRFFHFVLASLAVAVLSAWVAPLAAQEKSVKPGINEVYSKQPLDAHIKSLMVGNQTLIPVRQGNLLLGRWQEMLDRGGADPDLGRLFQHVTRERRRPRQGGGERRQHGFLTSFFSSPEPELF